MIWPFLMVYVSERLNQPLMVSASLTSLNAVMALIFSFIAGPIIDKFGRKWVMAFSLGTMAIIYVFLAQADTFLHFAILMGLNGAVGPLYRIGADAMMADLIPPERRPDAYALMRMSNNLGVAIGPTIGGFLASTSYNLAFYCTSAGLSIFFILITFFAKETLPKINDGIRKSTTNTFGGYLHILRDKSFVTFVLSFTFTQIGASLIWVLLAVYAKQNFQVQERFYGFIPATNALMVVAFQVLVTQVTKRFSPIPVMALGALLYAFGVGSVAFGNGFWSFWLSMVILTIGELIIVPTSNTYAANLAPPDMRGRYMSIYALTWSVASGIGPVLGGFLSDTIGPRFIWVGGGCIGLIGVASFILLAGRNKPMDLTSTLPNSDNL